MTKFFKNHNVKLILGSIRIPLMLAILGYMLLGFAKIEDLMHVPHWISVFNLSRQIGEVLLALSGITFIYLLSTHFLLQTEKKLTTKHRILSLIVSTIRRGLRIIFILVSLNIIVNIIGPNEFYIAITKNIIKTGIIAAIGWIAIEIVNVIEKMIYHYSTSMTHDANRIKTLQTKARILSSITSVIIGIVTLAAILMSFDSVRHVGISILASAGFLTAIIGLAASKALFSLFSGIQIVLSQTINIGDMIAIEKEQGTVEEIAFTYVIIKLSDNRHMTIPISYFVYKPFENWSRDKSGMCVSLYLYVDYMMPIAPLRKKLNEILTNSNLWNGIVNKLQVFDLLEDSVQLKIQISADNADNLFDLRSEVREEMFKYIQGELSEYLPKTRSLIC